MLGPDARPDMARSSARMESHRPDGASTYYLQHYTGSSLVGLGMPVYWPLAEGPTDAKRRPLELFAGNWATTLSRSCSSPSGPIHLLTPLLSSSLLRLSSLPCHLSPPDWTDAASLVSLTPDPPQPSSPMTAATHRLCPRRGAA